MNPIDDRHQSSSDVIPAINIVINVKFLSTNDLCDQQRGAGGVGGGGQQVRHPGGEGEHRGGDEVEEDVLPVQADQLYLHPNHGVVALLRPGLCRGLFIVN